MNTVSAGADVARGETKGPTVTAGESLSAAVGLEVPEFTLRELVEIDRKRVEST